MIQHNNKFVMSKWAEAYQVRVIPVDNHGERIRQATDAASLWAYQAASSAVPWSL